MYAKLDADGDGAVSLAEFHSGLLRFVPPDEIQERPRSFLYVPLEASPTEEASCSTDELDADDELETDGTHHGSSREDDTDDREMRNRSASSGCASASSGVVNCACVSVSEATEECHAARNTQASVSANQPDAFMGAKRVNWKTQTLPSKLKQRSNSLQHDRSPCLFPHSLTVTAQLGDVSERHFEEQAAERFTDVRHLNRSLSGSTRRVVTTKLFTALLPDATGCVRLPTLLKYFDNAEFHDGEKLLHVLQLSQSESPNKVRLDMLTERIEEAFNNFLSGTLLLPGRSKSSDRSRASLDGLSLEERLLLQAALAIYKNEMVSARSANEQFVDNARKLQTELDESNRRLTVLIKESEERMKEAEKSREHEFA